MKILYSKILVSFLICVILIQNNTANALSSLPKNAYLRLGDNQKEVKILQQILNSDPETMVDNEGTGSPGQENWYFGVRTEDALRKFQEKHNLEVTGRIDFKTWRAINNYVSAYQDQTENPNTNNSSKIQLANEERLRINEQNKKDFEEAKKAEAEKNKTQKLEMAEANKSYIQNMLDKYTGFFSNPKNTSNEQNTNSESSQSSDLYSNNYSQKTPYLNTNTGVYSSNPSYANQPSQAPITPQSTYSQLFGSQSPYAAYSGNPYSNIDAPSYYASQAPFVNSGSPYNLSRWGGSGNGDGLGMVVTTVYGHMRNGSFDGLDNGVTACGQNSRLGGNGSKALSLKRSVRIGIFGNVPKSQWCGKEIEITNPRTGRCGVYPLLEEGPQEQLQASMDMTGTVWNELDPQRQDGSKNWFRFRVLKTGDKGCNQE